MTKDVRYTVTNLGTNIYVCMWAFETLHSYMAHIKHSKTFCEVQNSLIIPFIKYVEHTTDTYQKNLQSQGALYRNLSLKIGFYFANHLPVILNLSSLVFFFFIGYNSSNMTQTSS